MITLVVIIAVLVAGADVIDGGAELRCANAHFKCTDGACIPSSWRCDGDRDCTDSSDEANCRVTRSAQTTRAERRQQCLGFKCAMNACIDMSWRCDGEIDCADGSDEFNCMHGRPIDTCRPNPCGPNSVCRWVNRQQVCSCEANFQGTPPDCRPKCAVNRDCAEIEACVSRLCQDPCVGTCGFNALCEVINHSPICSCPIGYRGDPFVRCQRKPFRPVPRPSLPEPHPGTVDATTCDSLADPSLDLDCTLSGASVNCSEPAAVGTVVFMTCDEGYTQTHHHGYNSVTCRSNHVWSNRVISCIPDCGRENAVGGQQYIAGGQNVSVGEFSWQVGLYELNSSQLYGQICGGALITPGLVITAAHCFWELSLNTLKDKSLYRAAAGKYSIDWYTEDPHTQRRNVSDVILHPRFRGQNHLLAFDIALVKLDENIRLSNFVNTVCVDYTNSFEERHLQRGRNGSFAGWGVTENNEASDVLKSVQLPYIPVLECETLVPAKFIKYLTSDKFCAGYVNQGINICPGDSGGSYVFPQETLRGPRFFIRGIASVGQRPRANTGLKCETDHVSAFTRVSDYNRWISDIVFPPAQ